MNDAVNSPSHYVQAGTPLEPIDVIRSAPFDLSNVIKYLCRAGYKDDELQDLKKAKRYVAYAAESCALDPEPYNYFMKSKGLLLSKLRPLSEIKTYSAQFLIYELESLINKRIRAIERKQVGQDHEAE